MRLLQAVLAVFSLANRHRRHHHSTKVPGLHDPSGTIYSFLRAEGFWRSYPILCNLAKCNDKQDRKNHEARDGSAIEQNAKHRGWWR